MTVMNKQEFLMKLRKALSGLPKDDIDERLTFYSEMIDTMETALKNDFYQNQLITDLLPLVEADVKNKKMSAYIGAQKLLDAYFNLLKK